MYLCVWYLKYWFGFFTYRNQLFLLRKWGKLVRNCGSYCALFSKFATTLSAVTISNWLGGHSKTTKPMILLTESNNQFHKSFDQVLQAWFVYFRLFFWSKTFGLLTKFGNKYRLCSFGIGFWIRWARYNTTINEVYILSLEYFATLWTNLLLFLYGPIKMSSGLSSARDQTKCSDFPATNFWLLFLLKRLEIGILGITNSYMYQYFLDHFEFQSKTF